MALSLFPMGWLCFVFSSIADRLSCHRFMRLLVRNKGVKF
jgi:hypothetical protein